MRFRIYSELSVRGCLDALKERMDAKAGKSRPEIAGWIEKGGRFSLETTSIVGLRFQRTTRLRATATREGDLTIIEGNVPGGVGRDRIGLVIGAGILMGIIMMTDGNALLGLVAIAVGFGASVPLIGDYQNSEILLKELRRATKARDTVPK